MCACSAVLHCSVVNIADFGYVNRENTPVEFAAALVETPKDWEW